MNWSVNIKKLRNKGSSGNASRKLTRNHATHTLIVIAASLAVALSLSAGPPVTVDQSGFEDAAIQVAYSGQLPPAVDVSVNSPIIWQTALSSDSGVSTSDSVVTSGNLETETPQPKPEPVVLVSEDSSDLQQLSDNGQQAPQVNVAEQEKPILKVASTDQKSIDWHDQPVPQVDLQHEPVVVASVQSFIDDVILDWPVATLSYSDELASISSESADTNAVTPSDGIDTESTRFALQPRIHPPADLADSNQDSVADEKSELTDMMPAAPEQKVAIMDRGPIAVPDPTIAQSVPQLETPPVDSALILPEGLEVEWSTTVLKRNDTLSKVMKRNGVKLKTMNQMLKMPGTKLLEIVHPKDELTIARSDAGELVGIEFRREKKGVLMFVFGDAGVELVDPAVAGKAGSLRNIFDKQRRIEMQQEQERFIQKVAAVKQQQLTWHEVTVRKGDTLGRIFRRVGVSGALEVALAPRGNWLRSGLMPEQEIRIATFADDTFAMIEVSDFKSEKIRLVVADGEDYSVGFRKMQSEVRQFQACATVESNLYRAAKKANVPIAAVDAYADIFASRVDFSRQLQKGDRYCMIFERRFVKDRIVGQTEIVAASLQQNDRQTQTFRITNEHGDSRYYDQHGENMLGHFLRAPVKSARVTSVFSNNRFHPILKKYRKHQGVDYGAARNTPIFSTADGVISRRANDPSGYGKVIVIQHGSKYQTLYAHMNKFAKNTSRGSFVKRGQVIGYVGSSGLSTGDHVHYEFRVNGVHRDPLNYPMPKGKPVPAELREEFERKVAALSPRLQGSDQIKVVVASPNVQQ
ncbi:MAG: peptidoglycan DD-metalloendopeptidase family protein [Acidiferrobacterales bacterium]|nr:peptidoglycan DD-metalloendopeptidase family protein [Acidiferrobacterales bacterium]